MGMGFVVVVAESQSDDACRIMVPGSRDIGSVVKEASKAGHLTL